MIVIVGLGAIGSVYAVSMKNAGIDVKVAVDSQRLQKYNDNQLRFNDVEYKFDYFTPKVGDEHAELIVIATKGGTYEEALELVKPVVGHKTIILPLLNGITSEKMAAQKFGWENVLYGYFIGHTATRVGRNIFQDGSYKTVFGEKNNDLNNLSEKVLRVKEIFEKGKIKYRIDQNMESSLWQKFVINIGLNQTTAFYCQNYGQIKANSEAIKFMNGLMLEAQEVAVGLGIEGAKNFAENGIETLNKMEGSDSSSMLQDVEAGRHTEVDMFAGEVCKLAEKLNIPTPLNKLVLSKLK